MILAQASLASVSISPMPQQHELSATAPVRSRSGWDRRAFLWCGGIGLAALAARRPVAAATTAGAARGFGKARSLIVLYLHGGHAQQETWDPKPDGPSPARGEFGAIATSVPGVHIGELLPHSARILHRLAIVRSVSHGNANHVQASLTALTGHSHAPALEARGDFPPSAHDFPPFGAVCSQVRPPHQPPAWVQIGPLMRRNNGTVLHGQSPGFLGGRRGPLVIDQDLLPADVRVRAVTPDSSLSPDRLSQRGRLLEELDLERRALDRFAEVQDFDTFQQQALSLLTATATARAFQLAGEPAAVRERYGRTPFGQRCLLARRLAEVGVPVINVHYCLTPEGSWDTHSRHFQQMKESLCPTFDCAFSALVEDLHQRGLLGQTLVLATAEFGRTPQVNKSGGRDHWPWAYSVALAGGGAAAGAVLGASDRIAAYPVTYPCHPADVVATVYHLLGVPSDTALHDQTGRPHYLYAGRALDRLLA
jgi:hypothetical protein